jgi:UDP-N-acetylglucosamine acyltransferase
MAITIGKGNNIHPTAIIYDNVEIGDNNYIGAYCVIGSPAEYKQLLDFNEGVKIGNNNRITEFAVINSGTLKKTTIGNGNFIMRNAHIAHDVVIGNDNVTSANTILGGNVTFEDNINIGMGAIIHQEKNIPTGVMIGMGAVVTKKTQLKPWHIYAGIPAKELKFNQIGYDRKNPTKATI